MSINLSRFAALVAEEFLNVAQINALLQQVRGEGVAQGMHGGAWVCAGLDLGKRKSLFRILSPSQKRLIFRHFSPFFSYVAPAMRLQKRKN